MTIPDAVVSRFVSNEPVTLVKELKGKIAGVAFQLLYYYMRNFYNLIGLER